MLTIHKLILSLFGLSGAECRSCGNTITSDDFGSSEGVCAPCRR